MITATTSPRAGFTLVEMLVVLAILAALSTVALRSADSLQNRARYEATRKTLEDIESGLLGARDGLPGAVQPGGLLADTGRFLSNSVSDETQRLSDLVQAPTGYPLSTFVFDATDTQVRLAVGWRGPYVRTITGAAATTTIEDGWGHAIRAHFDGLNWSLQSAGADGVFETGTEYDADVSIALPSAVEAASVSGNVRLEIDAPPTATTYFVQVFAYQANSSDGTIRVTESAPQLVASVDLPTSVAYSFDGALALRAGPVIVRAYKCIAPDATDVTVAPPASDLRGPGNSSKSEVFTCNLLHGSQPLDLKIDR